MRCTTERSARLTADLAHRLFECHWRRHADRPGRRAQSRHGDAHRLRARPAVLDHRSLRLHSGSWDFSIGAAGQCRCDNHDRSPAGACTGPDRRCWPSWPDLGERRAARLVAPAAEDRPNIWQRNPRRLAGVAELLLLGTAEGGLARACPALRDGWPADADTPAGAGDGWQSDKS